MFGVHTNKITILLPEYAQGTLTTEESARVEEHLKDCPRCRAELLEIKETLAAIDQNGAQEVPKAYFSSIVPRVHERLEQRQSSAWNRYPSLTKIVLPLSAAIVIAVLVWNIPLPNGTVEKESPLLAAVESSSPDEISELMQTTITSNDLNTFNETIMSNALANATFVDHELVREALASESTSPFNVFADVSPQQFLDDLAQSNADNVLQKLGTQGTL